MPLILCHQYLGAPLLWEVNILSLRQYYSIEKRNINSNHPLLWVILEKIMILYTLHYFISYIEAKWYPVALSQYVTPPS